MKKSSLFLVLIIAILLLVAANVFVYNKYQNPVTSSAIAPIQPDEEPVSLKKTEFDCDIDSTFYCNVWSVLSEKNELTLQIWNDGSENFIIQRLSIESCKILAVGNVYIAEGAAKSIRVSCPLSSLDQSVIEIVYRSAKGGPVMTTSGILSAK